MVSFLNQSKKNRIHKIILAFLARSISRLFLNQGTCFKGLRMHYNTQRLLQIRLPERMAISFTCEVNFTLHRW